MVVLVLVVGWQQLGVKEISGAVGGPIAYVIALTHPWGFDCWGLFFIRVGGGGLIRVERNIGYT